MFVCLLWTLLKHLTFDIWHLLLLVNMLIELVMYFRNTLAGQVQTVCLAIYPSVKN